MIEQNSSTAAATQAQSGALFKMEAFRPALKADTSNEACVCACVCACI